MKTNRALRGSAWNYVARGHRKSFHYWLGRGVRCIGFGFRPAKRVARVGSPAGGPPCSSVSLSPPSS